MDLSDTPELVHLGELAGAIHANMGNAQWLLIGAMARDLLMQYGHGIQVPRATDDIDLAIAVDGWEHFDRARQQLLASEAFLEVPSASHQLNYQKRFRVDLVPFGGVEREDGTIAWPPAGTPEMGVQGFTEALKNAETILLPGGHPIKVISLPMLVCVKIIACSERHARRPGVDLSDAVFILANYLECGNRERLFEQEDDLLEDPEFDYQMAGAKLAGRDLAGILTAAGSTQHIETLRAIIGPQLADERPGPILRQLPARQLQHAVQLLESFLQGVEDISAGHRS